MRTWRRDATGRLVIIAGMALLAATTALTSAAASVGREGGQASPAAPAGQRVGHGADAAFITRNSYGVPSIYAGSMSGVWFGAGWAQAQDRMTQLELTRRAVEGTLSAIFGSSELSQDETVRTFFYTPAELRAQYRSLPRSARNALVAFSAGINAYEASAYATPASQQAMVPYEFFVLGKALGLSGPYRPAPWSPVDTVAVGDYLAREFGGGGGSELQNLGFLEYLDAELTARHDVHASADATAIFNDARWIDDTTAPTTVPDPATVPGTTASGQARAAASTPSAAGQIATERTLASLARVSHAALSNATATLAADRKTILKTGISLRVLSHGGSNAVVVAPWRSANRHALLWGAPQEGFGTPSVDGEEYLHAPGYDAGGMYITGEPFILIGRNADIAFTTTSEETVDQRIYVEQVNYQTSPPSYLFDGKWRPMQAIEEQIDVAGQAPQSFTVYRTIDGPVFSTDPSASIAFSSGSRPGTEKQGRSRASRSSAGTPTWLSSASR